MRALLFVLGVALAGCCAAQPYPSKTVRIVVPLAAGGTGDTLGRLLAEGLAQMLPGTVIVENRPGSGGVIGTEAVARSPADGYTLLATSSSTLISGPLISKDVPFDTVRDFTPVTLFYRTVSAIVVKSSLPVNSIAELVDYAKRNPGKLSYGSSGIGSAQHLDGEIFKLATGANMVHVPYKGGGPQAQAVVAGEIDVSFHPLQQVRPHMAAGKVRGLALYGAGQRFAGLPALTEMSEIIPGYTTTPSWVGMLGPAGMSPPVAGRLSAAIIKALNAPDVRPKLEENAVMTASRPEEFAASIKVDLEKAAKLVKDIRAAGVQLE